MLQLAQPYLMKLAIDRYIASGDLAGINRIAVAFSCNPRRVIHPRVRPDVDAADDRAADHVRLRMQIYGHLQRIDLQFYDRNPVGRLMTRVTTDVDVINDMFTSGVVSIFGDIFTLLGIMIVLVDDGLAARDRRLRRAAAHCRS